MPEPTEANSRQYRGGQFDKSSRQTNISRFNNLEASSEQPALHNLEETKNFQRLTGYKDNNGSTFPFILINSPFGRKLRFLIDTGASYSFT